MNDSDKLLPCPFCGGSTITIREVLYNNFGVECIDCVAFGPAHGTPEDAARVWNTRPRHETLRKTLQMAREYIFENRSCKEEEIDQAIQNATP
jgi:Lar family restriction alleviation protein